MQLEMYLYYYNFYYSSFNTRDVFTFLTSQVNTVNIIDV